MPELALLLFHGAIGHHEWHPSRDARITQRISHCPVGNEVPDKPAAQFGDKPGLGLVVQPEPRA